MKVQTTVYKGFTILSVPAGPCSSAQHFVQVPQGELPFASLAAAKAEVTELVRVREKAVSR